MFDFPIHSLSDRLTILLLAVSVSLLFGGPLWLHRFLFLHKPAEWAHQLFDWLERKLNRKNRSASTRKARGFIVVVFIFLICLNIGGFIGRLAISTQWTIAFEILMVAYLMPVRHSYERASEIRKALHDGKKKESLEAVIALGRRDNENMDQHTKIRVTIEYLAKQFSDRTVAPAFWYLVGGLPGMLFLAAMNVMDEQVGNRHKDKAPFGAFAARMDDLLQLLPSRLAGILLSISAIFSPSGNPARALSGMVKGSAAMQSPNSGAPIGAVAGALGISLAGPRRYMDVAIDDGWIDCGTARIGLKKLREAQYLYASANIVFWLLVAVLFLPIM